jgi:Glyoxalase-like domain
VLSPLRRDFGHHIVRRAPRRQRFHRVPDAKTVKNRLHLDIHAGGDWADPIEARRQRVDAEATRLTGLGATITGPLSEEREELYAVGMRVPEGNEFDIN